MLKAEDLAKNHITNTVIPHGCHIYAKASDIQKSTMCIYPQSDYALTHGKCVSWCCAECPYINLPYKETSKNMKKKDPQLGFTCITPLDVVMLVV